MKYRFFFFGSLIATAVVACSGSDDVNVPSSDTTSTNPSPSASSGTPPPSGSASSGSSSDAGKSDDAGKASKDSGPEKEPGCEEACAKAYACKMVSSPKSCVCGGKAGSVECAKCWLSHTCDELKSYACYGACN